MLYPNLLYFVHLLAVSSSNTNTISSCNQAQVFSLASSSPGVIVQNNAWQLDLNQIQGSPGILKSCLITSQNPLMSGITRLILYPTDGSTPITPSVSQNLGNKVYFMNIPTVSISLLQIQLPYGTQPSDYIVVIEICSMPTDDSMQSSYKDN